jgi:uncharacterized iron-regulated membrane protein
MTLARWASAIHKWVALIVGVQMLFWVASGLFFAVYPIERVRSEHRIAEHVYPALDAASFSALNGAVAQLPEAPARVSIERDALGRAVAVAEFNERRPVLIDATSGTVLSPLSEEAAAELARSYVADAPPIRTVESIAGESPEYRAALPAWRVVFDDAEGLVVYVAADTGRITARRSDLWRIYDALWALHIMDWKDHEDFNTGVLIVASLTSLIVVIAGFILFPYRLRFGIPKTRS